MYSFEGNFRQKPQQSFGGASKKEKREDLLQRAIAERQKREEFRKCLTSSIKIQAFVRGCLTRIKQKQIQRDAFDSLVAQSKKELMCKPNEALMETLLLKLLFFYAEECDAERLIWLSQIILKYSRDVIEWISAKKYIWLFKIMKLQHLCFSYLVTAVKCKQPIAVPLRILEVFLDQKTYVECFGEEMAIHYLRHTTLYLVKHGFFRKFRSVVDELIPESMELSYTASTPVADCLMQLLWKPISLVGTTSDTEFKVATLCEFSSAFLCPVFTRQVQDFILPTLAQQGRSFPFADLIESLVDINSVDKGSPNAIYVSHLRVQPTLWLLYAILLLSANQTDFLSQTAICSYLHLLKLLMPTLNFKNLPSDDTDSLSSDSEDETVMDIQPMLQSDGPKAITIGVTTLINEPSHVQLLLTMLEHKSNHSDLVALAHICHSLLNHHKFAIYKYRLLNTLAFKPEFLRYLWHTIANLMTSSMFGSPTSVLQMLSRGMKLSSHDRDHLVPILGLFCSLLGYLLQTLHDSEFYRDDETVDESASSVMPFTLNELAALSLTLRDLCLGLIELAYPIIRPNVTDDYVQAMLSISKSHLMSTNDEKQQVKMWTRLFKVALNLVRQLHSRDTRRRFCPKDHWLVNHITITASKMHLRSLRHSRVRFISDRNMISEINDEGPPMSITSIRNMTILRELPFVIPFYDRVLILQQLILKDKAEILEGAQIKIRIRRNYLYEDAFDSLSSDREQNLKLRMRVQLVNFVGLDEAGIDGGGIFREFINELLLDAFNPNRGFFILTRDNLLYPNPNVHLLFENFTKHYFFIGRILGKAIYENMLVELPFASFFLSKLLGRHSANVDIDHLNSLDPVLYRNLLSLKKYNGDVADLGLDFTVVSDEMGENKLIELEPNGSKMPVTEANKIRYIHMMADYKLNRQIHAQCTAFKQGLFNVLDPEWIQMFNWKELQVLISGAHVPVDIEDLRKHTNYAGGYSEEHPVIQLFWKSVSNFNDKQRRQFLKFVTSCSRPPLLGFKELYPAFCIQNAGTDDRLPSSSTCMNLLKLPEFHDESTMKSKLLYAIEAGSGFELS